VLLYLGWERHRHLLREPIAIDPAQLCAAESLDQLPTPFVTLPVPRFLDTGVRLQRQTYAVKTIECDYVVIPVADKWLIAEVPTDFEGKELTGYLAPWTSGLEAEALAAVRGKIAPESLNELLPYQFEAGHDLQAASRLLVTASAVLIIIGLVLVVLWTRPRAALPIAYSARPQYAPPGYRPSYR
jgi:hypothetical protein